MMVHQASHFTLTSSSDSHDVKSIWAVPFVPILETRKPRVMCSRAQSKWQNQNSNSSMVKARCSQPPASPSFLEVLSRSVSYIFIPKSLCSEPEHVAAVVRRCRSWSPGKDKLWLQGGLLSPGGGRWAGEGDGVLWDIARPPSSVQRWHGAPGSPFCLECPHSCDPVFPPGSRTLSAAVGSPFHAPSSAHVSRSHLSLAQ